MQGSISNAYSIRNTFYVAFNKLSSVESLAGDGIEAGVKERAPPFLTVVNAFCTLYSRVPVCIADLIKSS